MKHFAFIDCFINDPANHCVNDIALKNKITASYHMPSKFGFNSLKALSHVDGFIILGSASHISEKLKWHKELLDFIIPQIEKNIPTLGICFGHQLIADYYGCEIDYIQKDKKIFSVTRELNFKEDFGFIKKETKLSLGYAHAQIVKNISDRFTVIAKSSEFEFEALKHKEYKFYSFQAHPEASEDFLINEASISSQIEAEKIKSYGDLIISNFITLAKKD